MKGPRHLALLFSMAAVTLVLSCAARKNAGPPPSWLDPDAPTSDADYFYGKGCAQKEINNIYLKRDIAQERARVDLAVNLNQYLVSELDGDTTAARAVLESVLPGREFIDFYADDKGNLCVRARLARSVLPSER